ncbi:hypothetical protein UlMin_010668 [Ulmus minor]
MLSLDHFLLRSFHLLPEPKHHKKHGPYWPTPILNLWLLDSGASHHVMVDLSKLSLYAAYNGSDDVMIGDGMGFSITHTDLSSLLSKDFFYVMHVIAIRVTILLNGFPSKISSLFHIFLETRYHQCCLDLMLNIEVRQIFKTRCKIIQYVRRFLGGQFLLALIQYSFLSFETINILIFAFIYFTNVETPMMNMIAGGAVDKLFVTHYNDLNMKMFMRIALELYLKELVVGGLDRVYEIGKQFRNEGIDLTQNTEFTTCEFYIAFADYNDLMDLTEKLLSGMVKELTGGWYHANGLDKDPIEIDFTPPFWSDHVYLIGEMANLNIPKDLSSDEANKYMREACIKYEIKCPPPKTTTRLLDKLVGHFLEETCVNPAFIMNHPEIMSPLAKWHRSKPSLNKREEVMLDQQRVVYMLILMYGLFTLISHLLDFHHFTVVFNFVDIELEWFPTFVYPPITTP